MTAKIAFSGRVHPHVGGLGAMRQRCWHCTTALSTGTRQGCASIRRTPEGPRTCSTPTRSLLPLKHPLCPSESPSPSPSLSPSSSLSLSPSLTHTLPPRLLSPLRLPPESPTVTRVSDLYLGGWRVCVILTSLIFIYLVAMCVCVCVCVCVCMCVCVFVCVDPVHPSSFHAFL
jgi:hypothetical protein